MLLDTLFITLMWICSARGQCGGFLRPPAAAGEAQNNSSFPRVDNAAESAAATDLVQCWSQFRHVTTKTRFRFKVTWRHVIIATRRLPAGTPWRVLVEFDGKAAEIDRVRGARLAAKELQRAYASYLFQGELRAQRDAYGEPVVRFSYHFEYPVGAQTPLPLRFTLFLLDDDVRVFSDTPPPANTTVQTRPSADSRAVIDASSAAPTTDPVRLVSDLQPQALKLMAGDDESSNASVSQPPHTTEYDTDRRRRTEAWVMAMCVLVGLSLGLILMATCVHPGRCVGFWRKRRAADGPSSTAVGSGQGRGSTDPGPAVQHHQCPCKPGAYSRKSAVRDAGGRLLESRKHDVAWQRDDTAFVHGGRLSLPEFVAASSTGDEVAARQVSRRSLPVAAAATARSLLLTRNVCSTARTASTCLTGAGGVGGETHRADATAAALSSQVAVRWGCHESAL